MQNKKLGSVGVKLFLITLAFIVLSNLMLLAIINRVYTNAVVEADKELVFESAKSTKNTYDSFFDQISSFATNFYHVDGLREILYGELNQNTEVIGKKLKEFTNIQSSILDIYLIGPDGTVYTSSDETSDPDVLFPETLATLKTQSTNEVVVEEAVDPGETLRIAYARRLTTDAGDSTVIFELDYFYLNNFLYLYSVSNTQHTFIVSNDGTQLYQRPISTNYNKLIQENLEKLTGKSTLFTKEVFGVDSLICSYALNKADWFVIRIVPMSTLESTTQAVTVTAITVVLVSIALFALLSYLLTIWVTRPIMTLRELFFEVENGNLDIRAQHDRKDDFGRLFDSFNNMASRLNTLFIQAVENEKRKGALEYQILKAQINPHFLYNTLDSIKWLANIQNAHSVSDITSAMIRFLKYNLSPNSPVTTLAKELDGLNQYIIIQRFRYGDTFEIKYDISEETLDMTVLHFMLQPIVENSLIHGFDIELVDECEILIRSHVDEGRLILEIEDNGVGIDDANLNLLNLSLKSKDHFSSIGLMNIHSRIRLQFGEEYGLSIRHSERQGLIVQATLPATPFAEQNMPEII